MSQQLLVPSRNGSVDISQEDAGWTHVSFRVERLAPGSGERRHTGDEEIALVPLAGAVTVELGGERWEVGGRASVFEAPASALYLPRDTEYALSAPAGAELATCGALSDQSFDPRPISPDDYTVVTRGAGSATREVATLMGPDFPAHRLLLVEVWTPGGNWSSYPPHKHDESRPPEEIRLEEIYYYRLSEPSGFAVQRLYCPERAVDDTWTVRDGDVSLIPWGYHTTAAAPGYDLYYLNVLAGDARALAAAEDPDHAWVRRDWTNQSPDPRVPRAFA
jgi:5-deoxy-glucuronate isomerase